MKVNNKISGTLGAFLFAAGFVVGFVVFAALVWADLEAAVFDTSIKGDKSLRTLRCPVLITEDEMGTISAAFHNPLDRPVNFFVRTRISDGFVTLMREDKEILRVEPGATERLEWTVAADDAAYDMVVLVKVLLMGHYPLPSRQATCGVLTLDVPFLSGRQIVALSIATSLVFMALGGGLWLASNRPLNEETQIGRARGMGALAASVLVGMLVGFVGSWLLGLIVVIVTALLIVEVMRHVIQEN